VGRLAITARACALAWLLAAPAGADRLVTHDGRILEVKKARELPDGNVLLVFESGEIVCPKRFVASVEIEGDMSDYVPANEDEKKKLAQGYVRYRGKWLSKSAYEAELARTAELSKARTAELATHSRFHDGWTKETKHFRFRSNTSPEVLDRYADLLETYYDQMDQRVGIDPSPTLKKTKLAVSIYKSRSEFQELTKADPGVVGFFSPDDGELHFYHDYQDPSASEWIALHEGTHLLTFLIEPLAQPCIWINEGVADFFGTAGVTRNKKGKLEIETGQLSLERLLTVQQAMADGSSIPLEQLFLVPDEDFEAFEYAHAWSLVYFLNTARPEYEKAFKKFFQSLYTIAKGVAFELDEGGTKSVPAGEVRRLLLDKLGVRDVGKLESEWKAYIMGIPIDAPQARFRRGVERLYSAEEPEEMEAALEDLEAAIQGGVNDPLAFWARGTVQLLVDGDEPRVAADYRKAVELAPLHAGYRANLAQLLSGVTLVMPGMTIGGEDDEERLTGSDEALSEAETHYGLACELAPDNEDLREAHELFLDLLQEKSGTK
jgi:hypothetical protein